MYIGWIIAALAAAAGAIMTAAWSGARRELRALGDQAREEEHLRQELIEARSESGRLRRQNIALKRDLSDADRWAAHAESELNALEERLRQSEDRAEKSEKRRATAERDGNAVRMKMALLEKELSDERESRRIEEEMYQELLRERDEELRRLSEAAPKKRRKKPEAMDQQVTLDDLLSDVMSS